MNKEKEFLKRMQEFIKAYGEADGLEITAVITASSKGNDTVQSQITGANISEKELMKRTSEAMIKVINEMLGE